MLKTHIYRNTILPDEEVGIIKKTIKIENEWRNKITNFENKKETMTKEIKKIETNISAIYENGNDSEEIYSILKKLEDSKKVLESEIIELNNKINILKTTLPYRFWLALHIRPD